MVTNFWDRNKKQIQSDFLCRPYVISLLGNVKKKKILDAGCGEGYISRILSEKKAIVVGIDISKKLIKIAKQKEDSLKLGTFFYHSDIRNMKIIKNESQDIVISVLVFNHLSKKTDWLKALSEIKRVLKKKGVFILSLPHPFEMFYRPKTNWVRYLDGKIGNYWKEERIKKELYKSSKETCIVNNYSKRFSTLINLLIESGFMVDKVLEPMPTKKDLSTCPKLWGEEKKFPFYLIIRCLKK